MLAGKDWKDFQSCFSRFSEEKNKIAMTQLPNNQSGGQENTTPSSTNNPTMKERSVYAVS
jgi:hypothetical protein